MTYRELIEYLADHLPHESYITQENWKDLATAYAKEYPSDAIQGLFTLRGLSEFYAEIIDIMAEIKMNDRLTFDESSINDFARIGLLFVHSIIKEIEPDVIDRMKVIIEERDQEQLHV